MVEIILTSWTPQKYLNSCLPGFPRPTLKATRLGKAYGPFGEGEALIAVVRKRIKKGEIELSIGAKNFPDRPRLTRALLQSKGDGTDVWLWSIVPSPS